MSGSVSRLQRKKKETVILSLRFSGGVTVEVGRSPSRCTGERTDSVVFSHALLSAETLVYVRIPVCPPHI